MQPDRFERLGALFADQHIEAAAVDLFAEPMLPGEFREAGSQAFAADHQQRDAVEIIQRPGVAHSRSDPVQDSGRHALFVIKRHRSSGNRLPAREHGELQRLLHPGTDQMEHASCSDFRQFYLKLFMADFSGREGALHVAGSGGFPVRPGQLPSYGKIAVRSGIVDQGQPLDERIAAIIIAPPVRR